VNIFDYVSLELKRRGLELRPSSERLIVRFVGIDLGREINGERITWSKHGGLPPATVVTACHVAAVRGSRGRRRRGARP
jgi:hypothetical protein